MKLTNVTKAILKPFRKLRPSRKSEPIYFDPDMFLINRAAFIVKTEAALALAELTTMPIPTPTTSSVEMIPPDIVENVIRNRQRETGALEFQVCQFQYIAQQLQAQVAELKEEIALLMEDNKQRDVMELKLRNTIFDCDHEITLLREQISRLSGPASVPILGTPFHLRPPARLIHKRANVIMGYDTTEEDLASNWNSRTPVGSADEDLRPIDHQRGLDSTSFNNSHAASSPIRTPPPRPNVWLFSSSLSAGSSLLQYRSPPRQVNHLSSKESAGSSLNQHSPAAPPRNMLFLSRASTGSSDVPITPPIRPASRPRNRPFPSDSSLNSFGRFSRRQMTLGSPPSNAISELRVFGVNSVPFPALSPKASPIVMSPLRQPVYTADSTKVQRPHSLYWRGPGPRIVRNSCL